MGQRRWRVFGKKEKKRKEKKRKRIRKIIFN